MRRGVGYCWTPYQWLYNGAVKFESNWPKTAVCIVRTMFYIHKSTCWSWPLTPRFKLYRAPFIYNLYVKYASDWTKTNLYCAYKVLYMVVYSAKVDFDLWPQDPKSIGFLLSSSIASMLSLKVIREKLLRSSGVLPTRFYAWPWTPRFVHRFYRRIAKFDLDLGSCDPYSIGFLL